MYHKTIQQQTQGFRSASHVRRIGLRQCTAITPKIHATRSLAQFKKRVNQFALGLL